MQHALVRYEELIQKKVLTNGQEPQILEIQQTSTVTIFKSNYSYLTAALAVMVIGFLVVIPTFHGFWEMGRQSSLDPLEIAKAFNAEILNEDNSNAPAHHLTKGVRGRKVRYGEVTGIDADFHSLRSGRLGLRHRARLELADPSRVKEPEFRTLYT